MNLVGNDSIEGYLLWLKLLICISAMLYSCCSFDDINLGMVVSTTLIHHFLCNDFNIRIIHIQLLVCFVNFWIEVHKYFSYVLFWGQQFEHFIVGDLSLLNL